MFIRLAIFTAFLVAISASSLVMAEVTEQDNAGKSDYESYKESIEPDQFKNIATLQALNKITAKTSPLTAHLKKPVKFGTIEITLHSCWHSPPEDDPESKALIEITEQTPGEAKKLIFLGWMFASSPALSAMEHPVYDITLKECS